jgi:hypothetical protein
MELRKIFTIKCYQNNVPLALLQLHRSVVLVVYLKKNGARSSMDDVIYLNPKN